MGQLFDAVARVERRTCWGTELRSDSALSAEPCEPTFVPGRHHLKNKFCSVCRGSENLATSSYIPYVYRIYDVFFNKCDELVATAVRYYPYYYM